MAWSFDASFLPATIPEPLYRLKVALVAAGWVVRKSGTGTAGAQYSAVGDLWTSAALLTDKAWIVIEQPVSGRQICIQTNGGQGTRTKYSFAAGFVGGAPSATVVPSATDEQVMTGTGTDAAPGMANTSLPGVGFKHTIAVGGPTEQYGFFMFAWTNGGNVGIAFVFALDPLLQGSYPAADIDPVVLFGFANTATPTTGAQCWVNKGGANQSWQTAMSSGVNWSTWVANPNTGSDEFFPHAYGKSATAGVGWKGISTIWKSCGISRTLGTTFSVASARDFIAVGTAYAMPWNGTVPVL